MRKTLLWVIVAVAATTVAQWLPGSFLPKVGDPVGGNKEPAAPASAQSRFAALPSRTALAAPAGEPFLPTSWVRPQPSPASVSPAQSAPPQPTYRVVGKLVQDDDSRIVLAKGNEVVLAREGETLEDGYRVEAIRPERVTLFNTRLRQRENLPIASTFLLDDLSAEPNAASGATAPHQR